MNKQLFIVGLILVLFIVVFWKQLKSAFTTNSIENFSAYPKDTDKDGLMKLHHDFIVKTSTQYNNTSKKIETLVNDIMESKVGTVEITKNYTDKIAAEPESDKFIKLMDTFLKHFKVIHKFDDAAEQNSVDNYKKDEDYQLKIVLYIGLQLLIKDDFDFQCAAAAEDGGANEVNYYDAGTTDDVANVQFKKLVCHFRETHKTIAENIVHNVKPKIKKLFESTFTKYSNAPKKDKTVILKELLTELIKVLFTLVYSISENNVACVLHSAESCPNEPYSQITVNDYSDNKVTIDVQDKYKRIQKFRCQVDDDAAVAASNKICAVSGDVPDKHTTTNCEVMNGYGKEQCENTNFDPGVSNDGAKEQTGIGLKDPKCRYDYFTEKCFNPTFEEDEGEEAGFLSWNNTNKVINVNKVTVPETKCHQISNQMYCDKQKGKCEWNTDYNLCVPTENSVDFGAGAAADIAAVKFCHSLSMKEDEEGSTSNKEFITSFKNNSTPICDTYGDGKYYYGKKATGDTVIKRKEDGEQSSDTDPADPCGFIDANPVNNVDTQEKLCKSLQNTVTGGGLCNFYKYPRYLPKGSSEKHKYITKCVAKTTDKDISNSYSPEIMTDETSCKQNPKYIWSDTNKTCIKPEVDIVNDCHIIKNSNICSKHSNCIWQSTGAYDSEEGFERGFCKDMSSKFDKLYKLMDKIHDKHLEKYVKVTNLEEKLVKSMPSIKNQLASLNL
jgi:hypothetical protein